MQNFAIQIFKLQSTKTRNIWKRKSLLGTSNSKKYKKAKVKSKDQSIKDERTSHYSHIFYDRMFVFIP